MFIPLWLFFLGTGTLMALFTLIWAIRSGQFEDQDRARYLPLAELTAAELEPPPAPPRARRRASRLGIAVVLLSGGIVLLSTLFVVLRHLGS